MSFIISIVANPPMPPGRRRASWTPSGGAPAENDIELVAFLTAPGELKITIGVKAYTQSARQE